MKKTIWIILAIAVALGAFFAFRRGDADKLIEVTLGEASRGDITSVVTATGKVFPEVEVRISSEVAGEIVELPVEDGQRVEKGALLVRVNPDRLEAQVMQQQAALRATESNSAEAKARMLKAELDMKRMKNLYEKDFATLDQVGEAETQYEIARASHQATLSRIEQQEMQLKEARDSLEKATTYAPIAGTVTALAAELGDRVVGTGQFEGTEIMRVADLTVMEARVEVSESDIVSVKIGDTASVEIEALTGRKFEGVVTEIANSATEEEGSSQDQLTTFQVKIRITEPADAIRPGMTATADIRTKTVEDVVKVPLQAVTVRPREEVEAIRPSAEPKPDASPPGRGGPGGGGRGADNLARVVFLYENGRVTLQPVETGIADNRSIEIESGLEVGQRIVTGSYRALTRELEDGAQVVEAAGLNGPGKRF